MRPGHPFLALPTPHAIAHRGGAGAAENTMTAFARAVDLGYRYLETDVRATADGVLLAFHDRSLDRLTDARGVIGDLPYDVVRRARIAGHEPIPLLEDLLGTWPEARVNIDVKDMGTVGPLVQVLRRTRALPRVCVAAFSDRRVAAIRRALGPAVATSLGPLAVTALLAAARGRTDRRLVPRGAACVQVPASAGPLTLVTRRFVDTAHALGLPVHVWTVDDPAEMHRLLDLGVDGIVTDDLEGLREVLVARGSWGA